MAIILFNILYPKQRMMALVVPVIVYITAWKVYVAEFHLKQETWGFYNKAKIHIYIFRNCSSFKNLPKHFLKEIM